MHLATDENIHFKVNENDATEYGWNQYINLRWTFHTNMSIQFKWNKTNQRKKTTQNKKMPSYTYAYIICNLSFESMLLHTAIASDERKINNQSNHCHTIFTIMISNYHWDGNLNYYRALTLCECSAFQDVI